MRGSFRSGLRAIISKLNAAEVEVSTDLWGMRFEIATSTPPPWGDLSLHHMV